jgi:phosphoglycerate dehydrogenase-like enzyme
MQNIIITPRSLSKGDHPLLEKIRDEGYGLIFPAPGRQPTEAELLQVIEDAVGYLAGVESITATVIDKAKHLKVISRNGTGIDNIDVEAARKKGIEIKRAEGANARGVAELTFGLIIAAARDIVASDKNLKARAWIREKGFELEGKTLGLIGCGKVGKLVARFALAFDMKVIAFDSYPDRNFSPSDKFSFATKEEVIAESDIISLHCPPSPDKKAIIGALEIERMKRGTIIINTARQSLVDEQAVIAALDKGHIKNYSIDAFDKEPPDDWTLSSKNSVVATPHIGGFTNESIDRATEIAIDNILESLSRNPG